MEVFIEAIIIMTGSLPVQLSIEKKSEVLWFIQGDSCRKNISVIQFSSSQPFVPVEFNDPLFKISVTWSAVKVGYFSLRI